MKGAIIDPEREIENIWQYFRVRQEFDENPLKKMYNLGGAFFGAPQGKFGSEMISYRDSDSQSISQSVIVNGTTMYGSLKSGPTGTAMGNYALTPYFGKGASSSSYSGPSSALGKGYSSSTAAGYAGGKGGGYAGSVSSSGSSGGGK